MGVTPPATIAAVRAVLAGSRVSRFRSTVAIPGGGRRATPLTVLAASVILGNDGNATVGCGAATRGAGGRAITPWVGSAPS